MAISRTRAEKTLSEVVLDSWNIADRQRAPRVAVWDESYKEHDPSYIDKERVKRAPFVKYPYLHRVTTTQTTIVMDTTEAAPRIVMAQPMSPGPFQRERSEMATELCEVQFRQKSPDYTTNNIRTLSRVVNMGLKYGNSYMEPEWIRTKRWWGIRLRCFSGVPRRKAQVNQGAFLRKPVAQGPGY